MLRRSALVFVSLVVLVLGMLAAGKYLRQQRKPRATKLAGDVHGVAAPEFDLPSLDGRRVKLSDFRGKAVLLNFWATWCPPCKVEMPWFAELQEQYGPDGLVILGVAMDDSEPAKISQFVNDLGVNYPVLLGTDKVADDYGDVEYLPTTFYIDRNGKIVTKTDGLLSRQEIEDDIKTALSAPYSARLGGARRAHSSAKRGAPGAP